MGVLSALVERARTGKGCQVDVSLAESAGWLLSGESGNLTDSPRFIGVAPGRRLYACGDGEFVSIAAAEPRTWENLCDALGVPELRDEVYPAGERAEEVTAVLAARFATRPAREWVDELGPLNTAIGAVNRGSQIVTDPHNAARGSTIEIAGVPVPSSPVRLRDLDGPRSATALTPPAEPGADTDDVLAEVGYTPEEIAAFRDAGVTG
jgi:crotonobetainyl-CoA:carnitine CoA-transferase CaiB-like acyl-CoA transferase